MTSAKNKFAEVLFLFYKKLSITVGIEGLNNIKLSARITSRGTRLLCNITPLVIVKLTLVQKLRIIPLS